MPPSNCACTSIQPPYLVLHTCPDIADHAASNGADHVNCLLLLWHHRKVKLGPTFFIPNLQIGSFGAITPFASLLRNRKELWDVAAAGPLAGCLASVALLLLGLSQSHVGLLPKELLVPVPTQLFQVRNWL